MARNKYYMIESVFLSMCALPGFLEKATMKALDNTAGFGYKYKYPVL